MEVSGIEVIQDIGEVVRRLEHDEIIGFDTESTGLSPWRDNIALMQFYGDQTGVLGVVQVRDGIIPEPIIDLFTKGKLFVGHNVVGFDIPMLSTHSVPWRKSRWYDTMVGETVVTTNGRRNVSVSLRNTVKRKLGVDINKNISHGGWANPELTEEQLIYAASDVINLPALMRAQREKAQGSGQEGALDMEMELMPAVSLMTINGLPVRADVLRSWVDSQRQEADMYAEKIKAALGPINLNSPVQLKRAISEKYGITLGSTAVGALTDVFLNPRTPTELAEMLRTILAYRHPAQRVKMYDEEWINKYIVGDWVHPHFWQCSAETGRFTCTDPQLQQWPKDARPNVGNRDGLSIVSADYSQIEVRIAAELAQDEALLKVLSSEDVHRAVASSVYHVPEDQVEFGQRRKAKALTFALLFDGSAMTLYQHSRQSGGDMTMAEANELEHSFFSTFTGLAKMRARARAMAERQRVVVVRLPNGLRRILAGPDKRASTILNTMVQGSAGVGLKYGIIEADRRGLVEGYVGATIHDELVAAVPSNMAEEYSKELAESMVCGMGRVMSTKVKVEAKVGPYWQA